MFYKIKYGAKSAKPDYLAVAFPVKYKFDYIDFIGSRTIIYTQLKSSNIACSNSDCNRQIHTINIDFRLVLNLNKIHGRVCCPCLFLLYTFDARGNSELTTSLIDSSYLINEFKASRLSSLRQIIHSCVLEDP